MLKVQIELLQPWLVLTAVGTYITSKYHQKHNQLVNTVIPVSMDSQLDSFPYIYQARHKIDLLPIHDNACMQHPSGLL
jgi:hypothetical protein